MGVAEVVVALLSTVAAVAPGVLAAITGQQSDADAIAAARTAAAALPVRDGQAGAYAQDVAEREKRG